MRIRYTFYVLFFAFITAIQAQQHETFGEIRPDEFEMMVYPKDSTANAVVLYERGNNYFEVINDRIQIVKEYHIKIKIFNERGYDQATISIPLRRSKKSSEKLEELKAITHNGANQTRVLSKNIFTKDIHEFATEQTFTFPNLKEGSILEYKYKLISPFIYNFKGWEFQANIPKIYSGFNAKIPGNYIYNRALIGSLKLDINEADIKKNCFHIDGYSRSADCEILTYAMKDIPAFKVAEEFMLAPSNYISRLDFELSEHRRLDGIIDRYTKSWKDVDQEFRTDKNIGRQLTKKGFFENHVPETLLSEPDKLQRAKNIYAFVQNHFSWNEEYGIYGKARVKEAFDEGRGSVSEINMSLINLLNAADIKTNLMLMSTRKSGLPKKSHPVMSDFNYCIAKLDIDGKSYLLDATDKYLVFGMLPYRALNYYGRVMDFKNDSYWHTVETENDNQHKIRLQLDFDTEDKKATGLLDITNTGYNAISTRKNIDNRTNNEYLDSIEESFEGDIRITSYEQKEEKQSDKKTSERLEFEIPNVLNGEMVYFNPFLVRFFPENPFLLEKRAYPVDFGYARKFKYLMVITIPEGYLVHELPNSKTVKLVDNLVKMNFQAQSNSKHITILFELSINSPHIIADDYENLKTVFKHVTDIQNNSLILFKKI
ncbi:hypothetical protein D9O36_03065 [Zobellia amurskyensis]|uniref:DUF3857 domain-containing protein n=1 Tax=Zobellia amurskyensis TaxID=248905 RepID=A0A7X2ZR05_9FLAO|nr:hypothetical protein [Zobellia amurskyensis]MUH34812.1 hypothetical protein [Zobellia amurskyensis]